MEKLIKETLTIATRLAAKAENRKTKLTRRMLVDDLKMIKLNLLLLQDEMILNDRHGEKVMTIFGPPGTGKTTRLLNIVEEEINNGTAVDKIGYFSFTK